MYKSPSHVTIQNIYRAYIPCIVRYMLYSIYNIFIDDHPNLSSRSCFLFLITPSPTMIKPTTNNRAFLERKLSPLTLLPMVCLKNISHFFSCGTRKSFYNYKRQKAIAFTNQANMQRTLRGQLRDEKFPPTTFSQPLLLQTRTKRNIPIKIIGKTKIT
eukprot:TRINITY_DN18227_c0_g3_i1.p1 TRINITY_DN18227_c0_g3~~TRINITY_DN18227_c0_g3_i1.p1  ORF type:complete len:158 (+),score=0.67 TRINITY_DN18227_c0_g3_i1:485-958(+)